MTSDQTALDLQNQHPFTEEWISVSDLEIDKEAQRDHLDRPKIERIKKFFNPSALGVIVVSRRNPVTNVVIDGMHRTRAVQELTDMHGKLLSHVFQGLTPAEESQMFLDLNAGTRPNILDRYRHRLRAQDPVALGIEQICKTWGWVVQPANQNGVIQAVGALERIYTRSAKFEHETNMLQLTLSVITQAWGNDKDGVHAVLLEGIAALLSEHLDVIDISVLVRKLQQHGGGPGALHHDASQLAGYKRGKVSMAVAEIVTGIYNRGRGPKSALPAWRRRS